MHEKSVTKEDLEEVQKPTEILVDLYINAELLGKLVQDYEHKFEQFLEDLKFVQIVLRRRFEDY